MKNIMILAALTLSTIACAEDKTTAQAPEQKQAVTQVATGTHYQGENLHNDKCTSCHRDEVYTREDRMVRTMAALENQVSNCMTGAAKAEWTPSETSSVIEFLNDRYYKF